MATRKHNLVILWASVLAVLCTGCGRDPAGGPEETPSEHVGDSGDTSEIGQEETAGGGDAPGCPLAVIHGPPGGILVPFSQLVLDGSASEASPGSTVLEWLWDVVAIPNEAAGYTFHYLESGQRVQFGRARVSGAAPTVNAAGLYRFSLAVVDSTGTRSCDKAETVVRVQPLAGRLYVQLTWTPSAPSGDCPGSGTGCPAPSVDLHVAHPDALLGTTCKTPPDMCGTKKCYCLPDLNQDGETDPWFHVYYDCFWGNTQPGWAPDGSKLVVHTGTGESIEVMELVAGYDAAGYLVAAHYSMAAEHGPVTAVVRFWVDGVAAGTFVREGLKECDLWWVGTVGYPGGTVQTWGQQAQGGVTGGYWSSFYPAPDTPCGVGPPPD